MRLRYSIVAAAAMASLFSAASAQAQLSLYGNFDVAVDKVKREGGNTPTGAPAVDQSLTRVSPSLTSPSKLGFRGTEPLGGGYAGRFQMEMSLVPDNGTLGGDGRVFGRMAWVGLTTPIGEFRLGRQASPMLAAYDLTTTERLGSTDVMGAGLVVNTLQLYQDNAISYGLKTGPWLAVLQGSPNAGVGDAVSLVRNGVPAPAGSGQILGGGSAGAENKDGRGRTAGAMLSFTTDELALAVAGHYNKFNVAVLAVVPPTTVLPVFTTLEDYTGAMIAGKFKISSWGTTVGANFHVGKFEESGNSDPETRAFTMGLGQRFGQVDLIAQAASVEFTNFTQGKNTALMFGADYSLSKNTAIFTRIGTVKDDAGQTAQTSGGVPLRGGPLSLLGPLGISEVPVFSGAGLSIGGRTTIASVGLRHSF